MQFICHELCELPFMLNLPPGLYDVSVNGSIYQLEICQNFVALYMQNKQFVLGTGDQLRTQFGPSIDSAYQQPLRTIVRHATSKDISEADLPAVSDDGIFNDMQSAIIGESPMAFAGNTDGLKAEARKRIDDMKPEELTAFRLQSAKVRASDPMPNPPQFLLALNALIRLYMQQFSDFFVEEVTLHQLGGQSPASGVFIHVICDGQHVKNYAHVAKIPPVMRKQWQVHPEPMIDAFKLDLQKGVQPDSVELLEVRARALLERGATRSSIIEASAALELSITRKLRAGYLKQGLPTIDIDEKLRNEINFKERANKLMAEATNQRLAALDNTTYQAVLKHRDDFRHGIAHADVEPTVAEADQAIRDFQKLRQCVDGIIV